MKLKYYSVASYIYKNGSGAYYFEHDKKIKTKTDYEYISNEALKMNNEKGENILELKITNIITFINK